MIAKIKKLLFLSWLAILNKSDQKILNSDCLLFCHDVDRGVSFRGKAYSPLIDSIREELEAISISCQSIAHSGSELVGGRAYGNPICITKKHLAALVNSKLLFKRAALRNLYKEIIQDSGAKLIISIGCPGDLAWAARQIGVFHIELLHGVGYSMLPWGWDKIDTDNLPRGVLSLDKISTDSFSPLVKHQITVKTIPHPFLKRFRPNKKRFIPEEWLINLSKKSFYKKKILISLAWGYAGDHGGRVQFKNILRNGLFFSEIEQVVKRRRDIFWFFRLHPVQLRKSKYRKLINFLKEFVSMHENCDWELASYLPYPSIAMHCSGNVGMNSMSCYDAAAMGVPSLVLCPTVQPGNIHDDMFIDLIEEKYVTKALPNLLVINDWVDMVEPKQPRLTNLEDDAAWEDALQWILEESGLNSKVKPVHE